MMKYIHRHINTVIARIASGESHPVLKLLLDFHIIGCSECRQKWENAQVIDKTIRDSYQVRHPSKDIYTKIKADIKKYPVYHETGPVNKPLYKKPVWAIVGVGMVILAISLSFILWPQGIVSNLKIAGNGLYYREQKGQNWIPINSPAKIKPGGYIKTDDYTLVSGKLGNSSRFWLNRDSEIRIGDNSKEAITLIQGDIQVQVNHHPDVYSVGTPNGVVDVYGTEFRIFGSPGGAFMVTCLENTVYFHNVYGRVAVAQGYQSEIPLDHSPLPPVQIDKNKYNDLRNYLEWYQTIKPRKKEDLYSFCRQKSEESYSQGYYNKAADYARIAIMMKPSRRGGYYDLGRAFLEMEDFDNALTTLNRPIAMNSMVVDDVQLVLGYTYNEMGLYQKSEQLTRLVLRENAHHSHWLLLGDDLMWQGKYDAARNCFEETLNTNPCDHCRLETYASLALVYARIGSPFKAFEELKNFQSSMDKLKDKDLYCKLAFTYQALGLPREEKYCWERYTAFRHKPVHVAIGLQRLQELGSNP